MEESNEIAIFDNEIGCSTESQTEEKEENRLNLNSESHNEGASLWDEHCDSGKVKIEERGISVTGVVSTESCSRSKAYAPMSPVGRSSNYHGVTRWVKIKLVNNWQCSVLPLKNKNERNRNLVAWKIENCIYDYEILGIDGVANMRLTCGITPVG